MSQFMSKVDQKRNWVELKSVQTLLRIACLANRKSYVVIIYANACEKLTKSENVSSWSRFKYCSKVWTFYHKRPVGLIAPPFIISFLATGNWPKIKLDDSAFFRTQSYITEICYFEYLLRPYKVNSMFCVRVRVGFIISNWKTHTKYIRRIFFPMLKNINMRTTKTLFWL